MKTLLVSGLVAGAVFGSLGVSPAMADPVALIIKAGSFKLSDESQSISGISLTFDDKASGVFGGELEWRTKENVAFGAELLLYSNDWRSGVGTTGDNDTLALMVNAKRYFAVSKNVFPFVGAGVGFASVDFTGPGGSASGSDLAVQAMAGIEFRADKIGFYTEAKYLTSKPEDDFGAEIDVTGVGLFAGLSITF